MTKTRGGAKIVTEPAYRQVASHLRREIHEGAWKPKEKLPTIPELQERFGVSRITIRGAIDELAKENLVYTASSRGTIVRSREVLDHVVTAPLRADRPRSAYDVFVETAQAAGREAHKEFTMRIEPLPEDPAKKLGLSPGDFAVMRSVLQWLDGEPWSWEVSYYPRDLAEETGIDVNHDIPEGTTRRIADRGYAETAWIDEQVTQPASPDEAHVLAVPTGVDLTHFMRTGATSQRVTRTTWTRRIAAKNRTVHELGDDAALEVIRAARASKGDK